MYPHERSLVKHLSDQNFAIIGVNSDQSVSRPQGLQQLGVVTWRSFQNTQNGKQISADWGVKSWPTIYLLDGDGVIRYQNVRGAKLDEAVATLLKEMGADFPASDIAATLEVERTREFDAAP